MSEKLVTYENLAEFKLKCDETYAPAGSGGGSDVYRFTPTAFDIEEGTFTCEDSDIQYILEQQPAVIGIYDGSESYIYATVVINNNDNTMAQYIVANADEGTAMFGRFTFMYDDGAYISSVSQEVIGGGSEPSIVELDADITPGDPIKVYFRNQDDLDLLKGGTVSYFLLNGYVSGEPGGTIGFYLSSILNGFVKYSCCEVDVSTINFTTLVIDPSDTLAGGSNMYGLSK